MNLINLADVQKLRIIASVTASLTPELNTELMGVYASLLKLEHALISDEMAGVKYEDFQVKSSCT